MGFNAAAQAAFPDIVEPGQPLRHTGVLLALVAYSAIILLVAGFVCAAVRKESPMKTVRVFALIQLVIGIGVEVSSWALLPVWYHLGFLLLLVPATVWGGMLNAGRIRGQPV